MAARTRLATAADHGFIVASNVAMAWETEELRLSETTVGKGVAELLRSPDKGFYVVAESADGTTIGQLMVTSEWSDWNNGHYWWIQSVYVQPAHRQQKVFTALFRYVEQLGQQRGDVRKLRLYVERTNAAAQRTYGQLGMVHSHYDMYEKDVAHSAASGVAPS